jgi:hypothetical protein
VRGAGGPGRHCRVHAVPPRWCRSVSCLPRTVPEGSSVARTRRPNGYGTPSHAELYRPIPSFDSGMTVPRLGIHHSQPYVYPIWPRGGTNAAHFSWRAVHGWRHQHWPTGRQPAAMVRAGWNTAECAHAPS